MPRMVRVALSALLLMAAGATRAGAEPALQVLGKDFTFPNKVQGLPAKLSDFASLQINFFKTNDGVKLAYWEAGQGKPIVFVPGWSANGAEYVNVMYLLSKHFHVYVLDPRNQGLSDKVDHGTRISRFAMDLKQFADHLSLKSAHYCGWSMGASVLWAYLDLFGAAGVGKMVFVDEPVSVYAHSDWSEQERLEAGGQTTSLERMVALYTTGAPTNSLVTDLRPMERYMMKDSNAFVNSESFASAFIKNDPTFMAKVMFDHASNDWRDVIRHKVRVPVAIFTGELSNNLPSQRWMKSVIHDATLYAYTKSEQGDHFLMFKNPFKFTTDLRSFLEKQ